MNIVLYTIIVTHLSMVSTSLFLHRSQSHRSVEFHPIVSHIMRMILWLTTGITTKHWVAIHRKHHQRTDVVGDPHSPQLVGLWTLIFKGWKLYTEAVKDDEMISRLSVGSVDDWIERRVYIPYPALGMLIMLIIDILLFGAWGIVVWLIQMLWIPFWGNAISNGLGHWWGYRNVNTPDKSNNVFPIGIMIAGEELHNNHHADPSDPKLNKRWFEFDIGWVYIKLFVLLRVAKIKNKELI